MLFEELSSDLICVRVEDKFIEKDGINFLLFIFAFVVDADERGVDAGTDSCIRAEKYRGKWIKTYF